MQRRVYAVSSVAILFGTVLAACVGDDPGSGSSSSSSGASSSGSTSPDGGQPNGATACSAASPCAEGACVDGFCCDSPCTGLCESCSVPGSEGKCTALKGAPTHGKCDGEATGACAGSCDGTNRTACTYPEIECGQGSCAGGTATIAPKCKAGTCPAATTQACVAGCFENGCLGVQHLATGGYPGHACAAMTDGKVRCWGANGSGQSGIDPAFSKELTTPKEVPNLTKVKMVAATGGTTCVLLDDGTVKCFGGNGAGQLGRGGAADANPHHVPELVTGVSGATFIAGGSGGTFCAIVANGGLKCWGSNFYGQIGDGTTVTPKTSPVDVCAPGATTTPCTPATGAKFVFGGDRHTCAVFAGDQVACWGENDDGECGQTPGAVNAFPRNVAGLTATFLAAGNSVSCAASAGGAKCWGSNGIAGRIGNCDTSSNDFSVPQSVGTSMDCKQLLSGVTAISTHDESVCAVANGAVKCWGTNSGGQLGDGNNTASQSYAASTAIATGAVYVTSGGGANYAIVVDGANRDVRCWGSESDSQCGTGTTSGPRKTPVAPKW